MPTGSRQIFYGWYVVYAIGLVMMTSAGLVFFNMAVLLDAFVSERGFSVSVVSNATAIFFIAAGVSGLIAGQFVDRFDPRYIIIGSATAGAIAFAFMGALHEPWQLFAFYIILGFAHGGCGLVPTTTIIARWFEQRRPVALSIASTGLSLGGVVFTPFSALMILHLGLAGAAPWIAVAFFLGIVPATLWIVRATPGVMGLAPDGLTQRERAAASAPLPNISFGDAFRGRFFIAIGATFMFALGTQVAGISHIFRLANLRVDAQTAAAAVALVAISSLIGRLVVGRILLRVSTRAMTFALIGVQTVGLAALAFADNMATMLTAAMLFGSTSGSVLMMQPLLLAEAFGVRDYGRIYSLSQLAGVFGYALGPALAGFLYEASGDYTIPYLALAAGSLAGVGLLALSGPTRQAEG